MYVPTWPCLNPSYLFSSANGSHLPFPMNAYTRMCFFSARYGIYQLFRALRFQKDEIVLVPDYHHGNEVRAIRAAGASIRFYRIGRNLEPDLDHLEQLCRLHPRALYIIHYLGWPQPMGELTALCRKHGMLLIEDCALSLLSESNGQALWRFGDFAIYCLYKTLPVPNGGVLVQNRGILPELARLELLPCDGASVASRSLELTLEWLRSRSNGFGGALSWFKRAAGKVANQFGIHRLPVGNTGFDFAHVNIGAAPLSRRLLGQFDYQKIREQRRFNYRYLAERLAGKATLLRTDLAEGVCPLFLPLLVPDKHLAAEALWKCGIGAVEFWNESDPEVPAEQFPDSHFLRRHVLELPIHQDVSLSHLDYIAGQIDRLRPIFEVQSD